MAIETLRKKPYIHCKNCNHENTEDLLDLVVDRQIVKPDFDVVAYSYGWTCTECNTVNWFMGDIVIEPPNQSI